LDVQSIDHVNIVVDDMAVMTQFYTSVLGMRIIRTVTITGDWVDAVVGLNAVLADVVFLSCSSGANIEFIQYRSPQPVTVGELGRPNVKGIRHIAFRVLNIDSVVRRCEEAGVKFVGGVQDVPTAQVEFAGKEKKRLVYFQDPEGNLLEFCAYEKIEPTT
jgi:catechol 2,3-dioxygenase-like lactoylglutathione lyase family enzyme